MSEPKRWTDESSEATSRERELLGAGRDLSLGADRKEALRRALATAILVPPPPDGSGLPAGEPTAAPPPAIPPGVAPEAIATASTGLGKLLFSGKLGSAALAFVLAAGSTAGVLAIATSDDAASTKAPAAPISASATPRFDKNVDEQTAAILPDVSPISSAAVVAQPSVASAAPTPSTSRPSVAVAKEPADPSPAAPDEAVTPPVPAPTETAAPAAEISPPARSVAAPTLVIPSLAESRLAEESARVRTARERLRAGDPAGTLVVLAALDRELGGGMLSQEREALAIEALAATGRGAEARTRADAFLARFPKSAFAAGISRFSTK